MVISRPFSVPNYDGDCKTRIGGNLEKMESDESAKTINGMKERSRVPMKDFRERWSLIYTLRALTGMLDRATPN